MNRYKPRKQRSLAIFWDYESCVLPASVDTRGFLRNLIRKLLPADRGALAQFTVYSKLGLIPRMTEFSNALNEVGGSIVQCNRERGKRQTVDQRIIIDMLTWVMDQPSRRRSNVVLVTGDGEYIRAVKQLTARKCKVTVVFPGIRFGLKNVASQTFLMRDFFPPAYSVPPFQLHNQQWQGNQWSYRAPQQSQTTPQYTHRTSSYHAPMPEPYSYMNDNSRSPTPELYPLNGRRSPRSVLRLFDQLYEAQVGRPWSPPYGWEGDEEIIREMEEEERRREEEENEDDQYDEELAEDEDDFIQVDHNAFDEGTPRYRLAAVKDEEMEYELEGEEEEEEEPEYAEDLGLEENDNDQVKDEQESDSKYEQQMLSTDRRYQPIHLKFEEDINLTLAASGGPARQPTRSLYQAIGPIAVKCEEVSVGDYSDDDALSDDNQEDMSEDDEEEGVNSGCEGEDNEIDEDQEGGEEEDDQEEVDEDEDEGGDPNTVTRDEVNVGHGDYSDDDAGSDDNCEDMSEGGEEEPEGVNSKHGRFDHGIDESEEEHEQEVHEDEEVGADSEPEEVDGEEEGEEGEEDCDEAEDGGDSDEDEQDGDEDEGGSGDEEVESEQCSGEYSDESD